MDKELMEIENELRVKKQDHDSYIWLYILGIRRGLKVIRTALQPYFQFHQAFMEEVKKNGYLDETDVRWNILIKSYFGLNKGQNNYDANDRPNLKKVYEFIRKNYATIVGKENKLRFTDDR